MELTIGRWLIEYDRDATRQRVAQLPSGSGCDCEQCRNFDAAAGQTFPPQFVSLIDALGLDPTKASELCHYVREPTGLYSTGGWFHFCGSILTGEDGMFWANGSGTARPETLVPGLEYWFTAKPVLVPDVFAGAPVVQLEFVTRVPWVLAGPAPEN